MHALDIALGGFAAVLLVAGLACLRFALTWRPEPDRAPRRHVSEGDS